MSVDVAPLVAIERLVQQQASSLPADLEPDEHDRELRTLIEAEIDRWQADSRRGLRPFEVADPETLGSRVFRNIARFGPLTSLLDDDDVWEIMINAPEAIFVKRHSGPNGYHDEVFLDDDHVVRTLTRMLDGSTGAHRKLDPSEGLQDAQLDDGARLHIVHGDLSRGGHVMVNIRKFTGVAFTSLDQLVDRRMMTRQVADFLAACVRARRTIVFSGAPGSGKTTLLSCCAGELDPSLRVVVAEEVFEADVPVANVASMQTRAPRVDRPGIDLRRLVAGFLRMAPDIAIVGEVRDREALPLLLTLSSGVKGFTTIHAGSARQALTRLRFVCQLADAASELPMSALNALVSETIDLVVHTERTPDGPRVTSVIAVEDLAGGADAAQFTVTELFECPSRTADLAWTGLVPARLTAALAVEGIDARDLFGCSPEARTDGAATP
ncbi:MAG TPA: ATPase, T2SS/T4P/T4SS family [Microthrixaceae bacterium]|nr:ATPase, T2SS/T4P/T4SS family [Microthrixaceae bacterium]